MEVLNVESEPSFCWKVKDNLWIGNAPPTKGALWNTGFDCVVLMAKEYQPAGCFFYVDDICAPIDDDELTRKEARLVIMAARETILRLKRRQRVLVTCMAGLNRSGLVCALSLMFGNGMNPDDAVALIRAARGSEALSNPSFVNFLKRVSK